MSTPDCFRSRLDQMIDLRHPLAVLAARLPWAAIEVVVAHQARPTKRLTGVDLAGAFEGEFGGGISPAGRPRLPVRLMASLLYLKNSFNLSDEELVERWAENVQWQHFSGMDYYEPRLPCDATQIGRFRRLLGEDGLEQLLKATIECALDIKAVKPADLERVIVDSTVQSKAISDLATLLERAERIRTQQRNTKNKLYALHAPEVDCISKGKARNPYEFGVKVSLVVTHKQGLMVGARSLPGNPYDGHLRSAQLEQTTNLLQDTGRAPKQVIVDLGYRGVDADNPGVQIIHRGKYKSLSDHEKRLLKRRQAIEPLIGHTKTAHRMDRCWLQRAVGDALHALSCAAGYNIRWLMRAIARLGLRGLFYALSAVGAYALVMLYAMLVRPTSPRPRASSSRCTPLGLGWLPPTVAG